MDKEGRDFGSEGLNRQDVEVLDALVASLVQVQRSMSVLDAMQTTLLTVAHEVARNRDVASKTRSEMPFREVAAEIGAALRLSDRTIQRRLEEASQLSSGFPRRRRR